MRQDGASLLLSNARVLTPLETISTGWVHIDKGQIAAIGSGEPPSDLSQALAATHINLDGQWLVPGFIDIHVHGADGAEVMDGTPESLRRIARFHAKHGTTGWLPTTLTASLAALERSLQAAQIVRLDSDSVTASETGAKILGVHLEGPFISPEKIGAQNPEFVLQPSLQAVNRLVSAVPGLVKKVTIAPELEGAMEVIRWLKEQSIIASIGHTDASYEETRRAIEAGAVHATHLFNAMRGLHHRDGGVVGACLLSEDVLCELIADGHHVNEEVMKLAVRLKGPKRIALITDAISATGKPNGCYQLGGLDILVKDGKSVLAHGHTLAGSTLTMDAAVRNMVGLVGVQLEDAIEMASTTPARELGFEGHKGAVAIGYDADLVVLDEALMVARTFVQGRQVFVRP